MQAEGFCAEDNEGDDFLNPSLSSSIREKELPWLRFIRQTLYLYLLSPSNLQKEFSAYL